MFGVNTRILNKRQKQQIAAAHSIETATSHVALVRKRCLIAAENILYESKIIMSGKAFLSLIDLEIKKTLEMRRFTMSIQFRCCYPFVSMEGGGEGGTVGLKLVLCYLL